MKENMKKSVMMMIIQNDTIKCFKEKPKETVYYLVEIDNDENI